MDNTEKKDTTPAEPITKNLAPPRKPASNAKWYAVIVVLIVIIAAFGVLAFYHPAKAAPASAQVEPGISAARVGSPYSFYVNATGSFKNITVFYGDGSSQVVKYSGNKSVELSHTYAQSGDYYIMYTINYGSSSSTGLINVVASPLVTPSDAAYRLLRVDPALSSQQLVSNRTNIFTPGSHVVTNLATNTETYNFTNGISNQQIVAQNYSLWETMNVNGTPKTVLVQNQVPISYVYNVAAGVYQATDHTFAFNNLSSGLYQLELNTTTANVNYSSVISTSVVNSQMMNFTSGMSYYLLPNTMISNISGLNLQIPYTNVSLSNGTALNFTSAGSLVAANSFNITVTHGTVANKTGVLSDNVVHTVAAGENLSVKSGANVTFMMISSDPSLAFNSSSTSFMVRDQSSSGITFMNLTKAMALSTHDNVMETTTTSGSATVANQNGAYPSNTEVTTTYFMDMPVVSSAKLVTTTNNILVNAEDASGGPTTLDPQIAYFTVDGEILQNTLQSLVMYNGSSITSFEPELATNIPSTANHEVNTNYKNYTRTTPWGTTYNTYLKPNENYTFTIRSNASWQDGTPVTAWDVEYTLARDMIFIDGTPGTGGFIFGQYYLPGQYTSSNTFYNITSNMTVDNATNSITIHFQNPMSQVLAMQILAQTSGTYIIDPTWLAAHGAGITWSPQGFENYTKYGDISNYNTYVENNVFADGPYEVSYYLPANEIVLTKNPYYKAPGSWYPAPSINNIEIQYLSSTSTQFLEVKSGEAQIANIPTSLWTEVQSEVSAGKYQVLNASPTLSIYFMAYNSFVNLTVAKDNGYSMNMPAHLFASVKVRKAFDYAFNLSQYLATDVGNTTFNEPFGIPYTGMIPKGMTFAQTIAQINATTGGQVPYYDLAMTHTLWNEFVNGTDSVNNNLTHKVTWSSSKNEFQVNGKPLTIDVMIPVGDPVDEAGMSMWASALESVIPGLTLNVESISYVDLYNIFPAPLHNPMPIDWGGWAPDYPYPSDYLLPMYLGTNVSTYMKPNGMEPWELQNYNSSEAHQLQGMIDNYTKGFSNSITAATYFHMMNDEGVNLSLYQPLYQANNIPAISSSLNGKLWKEYQSNIMTGANGVPMYNLVQYNS